MLLSYSVLIQLFLPSLVEYTVPLHFNFETCREQLAGICSFPTAVIDFSLENPKLSPGEYYEISIEIVLSESTIASNVGIFQAVVELVDQNNIKRAFRRSCFANRHRSVIYRIGQGWWNLVCKTLLFPAYFLGILTVLDDRKLEVSFTNRLVDSDLANTALLSVQLQNRFIETLFSSFWFSNLSCIVPIDETNGSSTSPEICTGNASAELQELGRSETEGDMTFLIRNDLRRRNSDEVSESFLQLRKRIGK
ncbi:unnamed protein product [Onchocerca flexuosa]|uniref:Seipin n=1 Tax=Onchocerca flexuosa TaxID=387005 RepID=A0A183HE46_9BILA|nr:unnamed protein product [Onchocerca flexuosa]